MRTQTKPATTMASSEWDIIIITMWTFNLNHFLCWSITYTYASCDYSWHSDGQTSGSLKTFWHHSFIYSFIHSFIWIMYKKNDDQDDKLPRQQSTIKSTRVEQTSTPIYNMMIVNSYCSYPPIVSLFGCSIYSLWSQLTGCN